MKLPALLLVTAVAAPVAAHTSADMSSLRLRIHNSEEVCTITKESQCGGQNWSGSTCCADSDYECRVDDYGANVHRCQKKTSTSSSVGTVASVTKTKSVKSTDIDITVYVEDFGTCFDPSEVCANPSSTCVYYNAVYAECKPETLPSGEMCGQQDGENDWEYPYCQEGEECVADGTESWCATPAEAEWFDASGADDFVYVEDFEECTAENVICKNDMSVCIFHHRDYAECKPWTLPSGELCGQSDDVNEWSFPYCQDGEDCFLDANSTDSYCQVPEYEPSHRHRHRRGHNGHLQGHKSNEVWVNVWQDCTAANARCKDSFCLPHSMYYAQCMPTTLPPGALCAQLDMVTYTNVWMYPMCSRGETCRNQAGSTDYVCTKA